MLHLKGREQGLYHFMTLAPSFAMTPGELTRTTGFYWFGPLDMRPLINGLGHAKVLEYLKDLAQCEPMAQMSWSLAKMWGYFLPLTASAAAATAMSIFTWDEFLFSSSLGITRPR